VPWLRDATHVLVPAVEPERAVSGSAVSDRAGPDRAGPEPAGPEPAGPKAPRHFAPTGCFLLETAGLSIQPVGLTAPWAAGRLVLDGRRAERIGGPDAYDDVLAMSRTAFAGLQAGVCAGSLAHAVAHTCAREQFGRPLSTNQAVLLRAADAYMDTEAIRVTAYEAAWRRDEGLPYTTHALTAAWWASEAGKRVVHAGQHLHGGAGADLDHPVHRHFLWGRQLDAHLGCGSEVLSELGALLAKEEPV
jgi:alkylation response protein AidB-like acyl-CoA dehydrogenase